MKNETMVAKHIKQHATKYAEQIVDRIAKVMNLDIPDAAKKPAQLMYQDFFRFLGESLEQEIYRVPHEWLVSSKENAKKVVSSGRDLASIVANYPLAREIVTDFVVEICAECEQDLYKTSDVIRKVSAMFDNNVEETFIAYQERKEEVKENIELQIDLLSARLVKMEDYVYLLPLIGTMCDNCLEHIEEHLPKVLIKQEVRSILVDFTNTVKDDNWLKYYKEIMNAIEKRLDAKIMVIGVEVDMLPLLLTNKEHTSNVTYCSSISEALDIA